MKEKSKEELREEAYIQLKDRPFQLIGIDKFYGEQTSVNSMVDFAYTQLQQKEAELTELKTENEAFHKIRKVSMRSDWYKAIDELEAELTEAKKEVERYKYVVESISRVSNPKNDMLLAERKIISINDLIKSLTNKTE